MRSNGKGTLLLVIALAVTSSIPISHAQVAELKGFDLQVKTWAEECRKEVIDQMELLITSGKLSLGQLFDTFYIPIPGTTPQKFNTQYDKYLDESIQAILDKYLEKSDKLVFVVATDKNGYVPTHNTKYSQPLTGDKDKDLVGNRTKRLFNDRTGLAAAKNSEPYILQKYNRETGEQMADLSIPIMIRNQHWGAIRIGYKP